MSADSSAAAVTSLDLRDLDAWVGKRVVYNEFWEPCSATDIRRWVQAMDYANPLHWDERFARRSAFGGLVAPQSFAVAMDYGHGCHPACIGRIPGSHLIFGGEEWWFYGGAPLRPGDQLRQERHFAGYKVADTQFAGPTVFTLGDTEHRNQHGVLVARERATAIRYLIEEARKRGMYDRQKRQPKTWTAAELQEVERIRLDWIQSNRDGVSPRLANVNVGQRLPRRVIGPHTLVSFALEYRAHRQNIWGTYHWNVPDGVHDPAREDAGFDKAMSYDWNASAIDPRQKDGLYYGPSSGHIHADKAEKIGMGGAYGYGSSMNAWFHDSIAYWAGHEGWIWHSATQFRSPAFEGDVTFVDGEVVEKLERSAYGCPLAVVKITMTTQTGEVILTGKADVQLPF